MPGTRNNKRAAGVVVVKDTPAGVRYLLLRAYRYWDLPKGRLEGGESTFEAAVRETREETGLSDLDFAWGDESIDTEPYADGKIARYYLAESPSGEVRLEPSPTLGRPEHHEFRWLAAPDARPLLVPRVRRVLDWAIERMGDNKASTAGQ